MIVDYAFLNEWTHKGHCYGECMSHPDSDFMYVNIPKNASSWTKLNLQDWGWEFYNYHTDKLDKQAIVVLRDPVDRWVSGIAEYLTLYHPHFNLDNAETKDLIFDRITFDDHTECQIKFLQGLDTDRCIFLWFNENYRNNFSKLAAEYFSKNKYNDHENQHVSENSPERRLFKNIINQELQNSKYLGKVQQHFAVDYELIQKVKFYDPR